jgi:precorrin-2 dehydrogenase / sirohydrochlorin ferrochelatase
MPAAYPLMLDVTDRLIVIIGGGGVAVRKAIGLLAAGATRVRIVAPEFAAEIPDGVERIVQKYDLKYLDGAALVFAATDSPEVNSAVVNDARNRSILVNRADSDDQNPGDFTTPAVLRQNSVTITVSTGGNPAIAANIRDDVHRNLDARWITLADAMHTLRPKILAMNLPVDVRRKLFRNLATETAANVVVAQGADGLLRWIENVNDEM